MLFSTNNGESKSIILPCIFLDEKLKNYLNTIFLRMFVFRFLFVLFFLFSNNALSMFFYTYIFYWNTIQYKYIISKFFCLFFLLLSNNTLHMFYTYICYWNPIQYEYIIYELLFISSNNVMCAWIQKIFVYSDHTISLLVSVLSRLHFISWSSPSPSLLNCFVA